jgi:hypothetical protein
MTHVTLTTSFGSENGHHQATNKNCEVESSVHYGVEISPFASLDTLDMHVKQLRLFMMLTQSTETL